MSQQHSNLKIWEKHKDKIITEEDILRHHHEFIRESSSSSSHDRSREKAGSKSSIHQDYGKTMAKKYYGKLYKEFQTGQIGCRWRTEKEVLEEKGERVCAGLGCSARSKEVFEMNFGYMEQGVKKKALVKVSVCFECGEKLNHKKKLKRVEDEGIIKIQE